MIRGLQDFHQNLASIEEEPFVLNAGEQDEFYIHSLCLNERIPSPSLEGTVGNVTIFEVNDKSFSRSKDKQRSLYEIISKNKNRLEYAKW